jgi:hypothetical protein
MDVSDVWFDPDIPLKAASDDKADIERYFAEWGEIVNTYLEDYEQGKAVETDK